MPWNCSISLRKDALPRPGLGELKATPGVYILIVSLKEARAIRVGRLRPQPFAPGLYLYVGSALGGLEPRIKRHLAREKRHHWHIDYLLATGQLKGVLAIPTTKKIECQIASSLARRFEGIVGFGSSDCKCPSHLFYSPEGDWTFLLRQLMDITRLVLGPEGPTKMPDSACLFGTLCRTQDIGLVGWHGAVCCIQSDAQQTQRRAKNQCTHNYAHTPRL